MTKGEWKGISEVWRKFLGKHWKALALFILAIALICITAVLVLLWFVGHAQSTALVPATLGLWSIGYLVTFILHLIFWEIILVGVPATIMAALAYFLWWKKVPLEERLEYRRGRLFSGRRSRATGGGGGGISLLFFIFFLIKVYADGNWNLAFASWSFDYLVSSYLWAVVLVLAIFGIPILLGVVWWLRREMRKTPPAEPSRIPPSAHPP